MIKPTDLNEDISTSLMDAMYALAATMIGADGKIEEVEIATAEQVGSRLMSQFEAVKFREICGNLDNLPSFTRVVFMLGDILEETEKGLLIDYLQQFAETDGTVSEEEAALIDLARRSWGLN